MGRKAPEAVMVQSGSVDRGRERKVESKYEEIVRSGAEGRVVMKMKWRREGSTKRR